MHTQRDNAIYNAMSDVELLARLIKCEAGGEGDIGMRAVATVIANRIRQLEGEYGRQNSANDVIYAGRQFSCVTNAVQNLYNMVPTGEHYEIAEWALNGGALSPVQNALWFYAPYEQECRSQFPNRNGTFLIRIGGHCFYQPTSYYFDT